MAEQFCAIFTIIDKRTGQRRKVKKCRAMPKGKVKTAGKAPKGKAPKPSKAKIPSKEEARGIFAMKDKPTQVTLSGGVGTKLEKEREKRMKKGQRKFAAIKRK